MSPERPEDITPRMINSLGSHYINKHPKHSLFHSNQGIACNLMLYRPSAKATAKDHWLFLAEQYKQLKKPSGTMASLIEGCFTSAFNFGTEEGQNPFQKSVKIGFFSRHFTRQHLEGKLLYEIMITFNNRIKKSDNRKIASPPSSHGYQKPRIRY